MPQAVGKEGGAGRGYVHEQLHEIMDSEWMGWESRGTTAARPGGSPGRRGHSSNDDSANAHPMLLEIMDSAFWGGGGSTRFNSSQRALPQKMVLRGELCKGPQRLAGHGRKCDIPAHYRNVASYKELETKMEQLWAGPGREVRTTDGTELPVSTGAQLGSRTSSVVDGEEDGLLDLMDKLWGVSEPLKHRQSQVLVKKRSYRVGIIGQLDMWWGGGVESNDSAPVEPSRSGLTDYARHESKAVGFLGELDVWWRGS